MEDVKTNERVRFRDPGDINNARALNPQEIVKRRLERSGKTFRFLAFEIKLVKHVLEQNGFIDADEFIYSDTPTPALIMWCSQIIKQSVYASLMRNQKVNHFPKSYEITRKDCFYQRISRMIALFGDKAFDFVPKTYQYP